MGIKVVNKDSFKVPGFGSGILRQVIGRSISGFIFIGFLWMLWDKDKQTLHDKISNTIVIRA